MIAILITLSILLVIAREICFKYGVSTLGSRRAIPLGIFFWAVQIILWARVLQSVPLSIAFPFMSLCYIGLPLAGHLFLKETIQPRAWMGIALITLGVICVGLTGL